MPEGRLGNGYQIQAGESKVVTTTINAADGATNVNIPGLSSIDHAVAEVEGNPGTNMAQVVEGNDGTVDVTLVAISDGSTVGTAEDITVIAVGDT